MVANLKAALSPENCQRLIVKIGSSLLVDPDGSVRREWLAGVVEDIVTRRAGGQQVIIVSSGAIALGARRLGLPKGGRASLEDAQAAAATGQIALSQCWAELLEAKGIVAAQMLVTLDDLEDRRRYLNAAATLERLLGLGTVPVINENDSVATTEIRFGDNDRLAARVAQAAQAHGVILLSDVDGLYTADPRIDPAAVRIPSVTKIDGQILAMAKNNTSSGMGSGGMSSKIEAARIATAAGACLAIISGQHDRPLSRIDDGGCGTLFVAETSARARQAWLAGRLTVHGNIVIDGGAIKALRGGASLLAAGAKGVDGKFTRGDVVNIVSTGGEVIARGLVEYDAADAERICGKRKETHEAILGYAPRAALVHRNHMALLS